MDLILDRFWSTEKNSPQGKINYSDLIAFLKNALIFLAPTLLVLIPSIIGIIPSDWKYAVIVIYVLNRATDLIRRFASGK